MGELVKPLKPHQIYEYLRGGAGTPLLDEARLAAMAQCTAESARALLIHKQAGLVQAAWEGTAGDAASGPVKPLADNAMKGGTQLRMAQDLLDGQSGSFHTAANSVRPVPAEPPRPDLSDPTWPFVDYEKQITDYQADAQHNIQVFRGYDIASEGHEKGMTDYAIVDDSGGTISVRDGGDHIEVPDGAQPRDGVDSGPFGGRLDPGGPPAGGPPVSGPAPGGQQTSPGDFVPPSVGAPGPLPGLPSPGQFTSPGPGPGGFVAGLPVGGFTAAGPGSPGGPGARGVSGVPGAGGPGAVGRGPGSGMRGGVLGAGPGVGALAAEEVAAQRAAAAAARGGGAGPVGVAPVGAGRGKGDEDDEHKRKVLVEADAEGLFGSDVLTAPQVIGDDAYEDD